MLGDYKVLILTDRLWLPSLANLKKWTLILSPLLIILIGLMTYTEGMRVLSGEYEFGRWMFLESSNKTWTWIISVAIIGGASAFLLKKAFLKK